MKLFISARHVAQSLLVFPLMLGFIQAPGAFAQAAENPAQPWNWSDEFVFAEVNHVRAGRNLNPDAWPWGARWRSGGTSC